MNQTPAPVKLRPTIAALPPYRQGKAASEEFFKLSSNENPFEPLPAVLAAVQQLHSFNRYPDSSATRLRQVLATRFGVDLDQVHVGAGSVSLLAQLIAAAAEIGDEVVYSWRSFEAYPGLVTIAGATAVPIPNRPDHSHDLDAMAASITDRTRVIIVCSPNNPTGNIVTADEFTRFMARVPSDLLVILDEAYIEFVTDEQAVDGGQLLGTYPNLVILRTFSKAYGLAGLRLGYGIGPVPVMDAARSAGIPLSVTEAAQVAAEVSLQYDDEIMERVGRLIMRRDQVWNALIAQGWNIPKPHGNFFWFATGEETLHAAQVFDEHQLIVRPFHPEGIRVNIGEEASVEKLLAAAAEIVGGLPASHPARRLD
ncbi:histidinol-phosphate transaminase [Homoserinimonas sp. OAct 916]|uniref:histidinol-phosphate transaminase n=1 Tax=Homoserinimonas sp. OAct 916 TaxID=2211450 RepID=UPI001E3A1088|nr:histidinol-phosphate transaminase [Homoserinimonas sp. OAct 916]